MIRCCFILNIKTIYHEQSLFFFNEEEMKRLGQLKDEISFRIIVLVTDDETKDKSVLYFKIENRGNNYTISSEKNQLALIGEKNTMCISACLLCLGFFPRMIR